MSIAAFSFPDSAWSKNLIHRGGVYQAMPLPGNCPGRDLWQVCDMGGTVAMSGPSGAIACDEAQARRIAAAWNKGTKG